MTEESGSPIQDIPARAPVATLVPPVSYSINQYGSVTLS